MSKNFDFRGFHSLKEYEKECKRVGYSTRRVPFQKDGKEYFVFVISPPKKTITSVEGWYLFEKEDEDYLLDCVIGLCPQNYIGKLAQNGFHPCDPDEEERVFAAYKNQFDDAPCKECTSSCYYHRNGLFSR